MPTVDLFPIEFRKNLPPLNAQERDPDPIVYIKFLTRNSSWAWYATEGCPEDDDFIFFGFVCRRGNREGAIRPVRIERSSRSVRPSRAARS
jgi:hypothetical protein